ncbi:MAG TPA: Ppx/GppA phosphatase family protein [Bryobacteraceae bacterium]|nr:Ppx/GppA phosphatase family protein [Bryobacteraceae bacterium]
MLRYAAIDIGSNSVRMMAAEVEPAMTRILAQERQVTRLGESVFRNGRISNEALDFLCATLTRYAAGYQKFDVQGVRAVATSAVRDSSNQQEFLDRAGAAIGTPVEIISGQEEARLIHLGVEARWPRPRERTLIIDVGGGSAELILSHNGELLDAVSRPLGAVRLTELFLESDPAAPDELHRMDAYIDEKLVAFHKRRQGEKLDRVVATSATAAAIVCAVNKVPRQKRDAADRLRARTAQIRQLYAEVAGRSLAARRKMVGIGPRRAEIIVAGSAVFLRTLELFGCVSLYYSTAGVRDGIIADLAARGVGRELSQLSREQLLVVEGMAKRYGVVLRHAKRVAFLAHRLFELLQTLHGLPPAAGKLLQAAAYLHDVGHFVSETGHHKHSAYLIANADLPGFTNKERVTIASLCRFHRKSMPQPRHMHFQALDPDSKRVVISLIPLLRIADALDRGHGQRVHDLDSIIKTTGLQLLVKADQDVVKADQDADLEIWAAGEAAQAFEEVYSLPVTVQRARTKA